MARKPTKPISLPPEVHSRLFKQIEAEKQASGQPNLSAPAFIVVLMNMYDNAAGAKQMAGGVEREDV